MMKGQYKNGKPFDRRAYMKIYNKKFYQENREREKERTKKYSRSNPDKVIQMRKNWCTKNGIAYRKKNVKVLSQNTIRWRDKRMKIDPVFRLGHTLRHRVLCALMKVKTKRKHPIEELLGCSIAEAREYIEKRFENWMNWDNHGQWHIDHRMPLASFDLTDSEQQKKAFHYTNLQPLSAKENKSKGAKILDRMII